MRILGLWKLISVRSITSLAVRFDRTKMGNCVFTMYGKKTELVRK